MLFSYFSKQYIEAGVDEAGRGCLAGPVVASAVILPKNYEHPSLNDSKQLSNVERKNIKKDIVKDALAYGIAEINNHQIDTFNILNASIMAMHKSLEQLNPSPELILVDGKYFKPWNYIPYKCITKGDAKYLSIAAASILAKCHRDELMQKLAHNFPAYGWHNNVGYPTLSHRKAIVKHGTTIYHRKSFKLYNNIK